MTSANTGWVVTSVTCMCMCVSDLGPSNQMMTLASQIIAAMPERIKLSPSQSKQLLADEIQSRRNRAASYGSSLSSYSSACSSNVTPPSSAAAISHNFTAEDSGVSTPLDGPSFLEYRSVSLSDLSVTWLWHTATMNLYTLLMLLLLLLLLLR